MYLAASLVVAIVNVHAYAPLCEKMKSTPGSEYAILMLGYIIFPPPPRLFSLSFGCFFYDTRFLRIA